jgi:L-aspartate oxidase
VAGTFDRLVEADVIVVGSGIGGLTAALGAAPLRVIVVTKGGPGGGSTHWAQGGIAAAVGEGDSAAAHATDTLAAGAGLNHPEAVSLLTSSAAERVADLASIGVHFDLGGDGRPELGREGGHHRRRILHAGGDATGAEVVRALTRASSLAEHVDTVDRCFAAELVVDVGRVVGVTARTDEGERLLLSAPAVVLATGGIGRVYANTTNPAEVTGDGLAMAARAGAVLADLEFVQFHPTALASGRDPMPLLTEALRGEGALLVDDRGQRFMVGEHPDAELAPRDVVARVIWRKLDAGHRVFLDARASVGASFPADFPTVYELCLQDGIDPRRELVPVAPAAHFHMGGVATDLNGRTSLPGLWAVGEVACTGVHGANRLASNSLLEAAVFGNRAAADVKIVARIADGHDAFRAGDPGPAPGAQPELVAAMREVMWARVGVVRDRAGMVAAIERLEDLRRALEPGCSEARNMIEVGILVARAAVIRTESRGAHFRLDYPDPDPAWARAGSPGT